MSVKAEKTKEKILDTALRHFLKDGIQWSIFEEYCERCRTHNRSIL